MNRYIFSLLTMLCCLTSVAQTYTDELRRDHAGQGTVVVNQSAEIERLVNAVPQRAQPVATTAQHHDTATATTPATAPVHHDTTTPAAPATHHDAPATGIATGQHQAPTTETEAPTVNTNKKIMRRSYKTTGYRIQVYSGGNKRADRERCEQISAQLKSHFPDLPIYVHFYSPSWKCRAGNYTDYGEARAMLRQVRALGYSQACLVKGTVSVQY